VTPLLLTLCTALAGDGVWDVGSAPVLPDRAAVRVSGALSPGPTLLGFGDVEGVLPLWTSTARAATLAVSAEAGWVLSTIPAEGRTAVRERRVGGGLWVVLSDPGLRQRHAIGLVSRHGNARWFRWHPDEADTAMHIAYEGWIPLTPRVALRGGTWVGFNRLQGIPPHLRSHLGVVGEVHDRVALYGGLVLGTPWHLQGVVSLSVRPTPLLTLGADVQLPVRAPGAWTVPIPTTGLRLTVGDGRAGLGPGPPWGP